MIKPEHKIEQFHGFQKGINLILILLGGMIVLGWWFKQTTWLNAMGTPPLVLSSGVSWMLMGCALLCFQHPEWNKKSSGWLCIGIILFINLMNLCSFWTSSIRGFQYPELHQWHMQGEHPGQEAWLTSVLFCLSCGAVALAYEVRSRFQAWVLMSITFIILAIGLTGLAMVNWMPDVLWGWSTESSLNGTGSFLFIGVAISLWCQWKKQEWYMQNEFIRLDELIRFYGASLFVMGTLTAGLLGFAYQQKMMRNLLEERLIAQKNTRLDELNTHIKQFKKAAPDMIVTSGLDRAARSRLNLNQPLSLSALEYFDHLFKEVTSQRLTGLQLRDRNQQVVASAGSLLKKETLNTFKTKDPDVSLRWDQRFYLVYQMPIDEVGYLWVEEALDAWSERVQNEAYHKEMGLTLLCKEQQKIWQCLHPSKKTDWKEDQWLNLVQRLDLKGSAPASVAVIQKEKGPAWLIAGGELTPGSMVLIEKEEKEVYLQSKEYVLRLIGWMVSLGLLGGVLLYSQLWPLAQQLIEATRLVHEKEGVARSVLEGVSDSVILVDDQGVIRDVNPAVCALFQYNKDELIGSSVTLLFHDEILEVFLNQDKWPKNESSTAEKNLKEFNALDKDQNVLAVEVQWDSLTVDGQSMKVGIIRDIRERKEAVMLLEKKAQYDELTGLPNRTLFMDRIKGALSRQNRFQKTLAVLFIDLDGFKEVNDELTHKGGDALLVMVAHRLKSCIRQTDTLARLGGDEFTIILEDIQDASKDVKRIAQNIIEELSDSFKIMGVEVSISASIGGVILPYEEGLADDDLINEDLINQADEWMYEAKRSGKNQSKLSFFKKRVEEDPHQIVNKDF